MTSLLRRLVPPKLLLFARFLYQSPRWFTPPVVTYVKRRINFELANRPTRYEASVLARNAKFRDMYAGRRCFVIGNGPSLNKQDLSPLAGEITIVMNRFNEHPIIEKWKPIFFCMADPAESIKRIDLSAFLEKIEAQAYFFQIGVKEIFDEKRLLEEEKVYYFKLTGSLNDYQSGKRKLDLTKPIPAAWTTAQTAIMIALYMGCSPIYLIGLDHDGLAYPSSTNWKHFYQEFHNRFDVNRYTYKFRMEQWLSIWRGYEKLLYMASKKGTDIYNATAGGFLDVFPLVEFESLFP